jgi:type IV pilus assembly PilX-like protein
VAIILAFMFMLLMSALGAATILNTSAETLIAANFRDAHEGLYAADAALQLAIGELDALPDWNAVLDGSTASSFIDGPPSGARTLADGSLLDLGQLLNLTSCRKATSCSVSDLTAKTAQRPWGLNNPLWRMFSYGPLSTLLQNRTVDSTYYVVGMVADDPSENDNDPARDGHSPSNPGTDVLSLRAEAFGPRGTHQIVEATIGRIGGVAARITVLSWRQVR